MAHICKSNINVLYVEMKLYSLSTKGHIIQKMVHNMEYIAHYTYKLYITFPIHQVFKRNGTVFHIYIYVHFTNPVSVIRQLDVKLGKFQKTSHKHA
jgi:hypothetical protein